MRLIPKTDKTSGIRLTDIGVSTCWYRPITCILWSILGVSNQSHFFCRVARLWRNMSCRTSRNYCLLVAVLCTLVFIYSIPGSRRIILQVCYVMLCNHSFSSVCSLFIFHQLAMFHKRTSRIDRCVSVFYPVTLPIECMGEPRYIASEHYEASDHGLSPSARLEGLLAMYP